MSRDMRRRTAEATRALAVAGHSDMIWGHLALRDPDGRGVWMKASGWGLEEVDEARVLLVGWDGEVLDGDGRRHIEYHIHTEIMRRRPDVGASVHTHPEDVNVFSSLDIPLLALSHDAVPFADPQIPRFTVTGDLVRTAELGALLAGDLGAQPACLMPKHGMVAVGVDEAFAVMHAALLSKACRSAVQAHAAGGPRVFSDAAEISDKKLHAWPEAQIRAGYAYLLRRAAALT
ncbi:MAG: class II aldolase/adducin family protein [Microbacterium sp.]